ncbi:MAG: sialate O-acetylesterase [Marinobacter sp.]|jgi:hypothetical protein
MGMGNCTAPHPLTLIKSGKVEEKKASLVKLVGLSGAVEGQRVATLGYLEGSGVGGAAYVWRGSVPKSAHDGIRVISPTVPWDGAVASLGAFQAGTGETDAAGLGCWVAEMQSAPEQVGAVWQGETDIFIVYGQSNARGYANNTAGDPPYKTPLVTCWDGSGEIRLTNYMPTLNDGTSTGGAWVAFANEYARLTGRRAIIANCANGSQSVAELSKGAANTNYSGLVSWVGAIESHITGNGGTVGRRDVLFWQGERDSQLETPPGTYKAAIDTLWSDLKLDIAADTFNIITVGSYTLTSVKQAIPIQKVQREWARETDGVFIIYDDAQSLGASGLKTDNVHMNQQGYNLVGTYCAREYVESNLRAGSKAAPALLQRYGQVNLDGSQDWEYYGGIIEKSGLNWVVSANGENALSGVLAANVVDGRLELTLADAFDYVLAADVSVIGENNPDLKARIVRNLEANTDANGRVVAQVEFFADVTAIITDMAAGTVTTAFQNGNYDNGITVTPGATGVVNIDHPEIYGAASAWLYGTTAPRVVACKTSSATATQVRAWDAAGALADSQVGVMLPNCRIDSDWLNSDTKLSIRIIATKKVTQ